MRNSRAFLILAVIALSGFGSAAGAEDRLADIYRTGKIRLEPDVVIDDESLGGRTFFESVVDLARDGSGRLYVADYKANHIKRFDADGHFQGVIGREGQGPGEFQWPWNIAVSPGRLYVWDMRNRRLCALTPDGEFLRSVSFQIHEGRPQKFRALPGGGLVVEMEVTHYQEPDRPQDSIIRLFSADLEPGREIYTRPVWKNRYARIEGRFSNLPQPFPRLVYWDLLPGGRVVVGFSDEYKLEIHDPAQGRLNAFERACEPVKIGEADKKRFFDSISFSDSQGNRSSGPSDYLKKNTTFPPTFPVFSGIVVDGEGHILVNVFTRDRKAAFHVFNAFDPRGEFIARVRIEGEASFCGRPEALFDGDGVWVQEKDDEGLIRIVRYRIAPAED